MKLKDGKSKVLTLSYDDGVVQDIRLMEILDRNGIKATFNINTGMYLPEDTVREKYYGRMKLSEALALYKDSGHEVAVHGLTHPALDRIPTDEALTEILEDRKNIEKQYGTLARGMAYPGGTYSQTVMDELKLCGICYARTIKSTEQVTFPQNWLEWNPTCHHKNPKLMELTRRFVDESPRYGNQVWMLYVWGHSFEFDNQDNWNVIEEFAQYAGGKDDIWYATNIEIYEYVEAYNSMRLSADCKIMHNPTCRELFFEVGGKIRSIKPGETITL
jgi:peptidoglycan/xylan/chitin deacetylase (PgdA/CDA1 family)